MLRGTTLGAGRLVVMQKERSDMPLEVAGGDTLRPLRSTTVFDRWGLQGLQIGFDTASVRQQLTFSPWSAVRRAC